MEILLVGYLLVGLYYANGKVNNPDPTRRPAWASDESIPFVFRTAGFLIVTVVWPLSMLMHRR